MRSAWSLCETERSCASLVDEVDVRCRHCEIGGQVSAAEVSQFAGISPGTAVSRAASWSPTLSRGAPGRSAGELSLATSWSPTPSKGES